MKTFTTNLLYFICVATFGCLLITLEETNAMVNPILRAASQSDPGKPEVLTIKSVSTDNANAIVESGAKQSDLVQKSQVAPGNVIGANDATKLEIHPHLDVHELNGQPLKPKKSRALKKRIRLQGDLSKRGNTDSGHHVSTEEESSEEIRSDLPKSITQNLAHVPSEPEQTSATTTSRIDTIVETITAPDTTTLASVPQLPSGVLPLMPTTTTSMDIVTPKRLSLMDEIKKARDKMNNKGCPNFTEFIKAYKDTWGELKDTSGLKAKLGVVIDSSKTTFQSFGACIAEILLKLESYFKGKPKTTNNGTENGFQNSNYQKEKPVVLT